MKRARTPLAVEVGKLASRSISRRDLLAGLGAGAASLALGQIHTPYAKPNVLIVGAGMAGLSAAYHLERAGIRSKILEASSRVGGRMKTVRNAFGQGIATEMGAEFIDSGHEDMLWFARRLGLRLIDVMAPSESSLKSSYFFGGRLRTEEEIISEFRPIAEKIAEDYDAAEFNSYSDYNDRAAEIDAMTIPRYLDSIGCRGWLKSLLMVAYTTEFGIEASEQSALNLVYLIGTDLTEGFKEFGESDQRYKIAGGNDLIPSRIASGLGSQIIFNQSLFRLERRGRGFRATTLDDRTRMHTFDADVVLLTIPFSVLRRIQLLVDLPEVKKRAIRELTYGTNAKMIVGYPHRFWRRDGQSGLFFTDTLSQSGWDSTQLQPGEKGSMTAFFGGQRGASVERASQDVLRERVAADLARIFPSTAGKATFMSLRTDWISNPLTLGSYPSYKAGQYVRFGGAEQEPVGRLFFAGDHCTLDYQGYMNGAALTGREAAEAIAAM